MPIGSAGLSLLAQFFGPTPNRRGDGGKVDLDASAGHQPETLAPASLMPQRALIDTAIKVETLGFDDQRPPKNLRVDRPDVLADQPDEEKLHR